MSPLQATQLEQAHLPAFVPGLAELLYLQVTVELLSGDTEKGGRLVDGALKLGEAAEVGSGNLDALALPAKLSSVAVTLLAFTRCAHTTRQ